MSIKMLQWYIKLRSVIGIGINYQNDDGNTSLMWASQYHYEMVQFLISRRASVNLQNNDGVTALMAATHNRKWQLIDDIIGLLINAGANIDLQTTNGGYTAIMAAVYNKKLKSPERVLEILINAGANLYLRCNIGTRILEICIVRKLPNCVTIIVKKFLHNYSDVSPMIN